uniref:Uncharacterized protein n=1 Tax=Amphora coffeiformis TaxID=265554 RepID=A0A7S3L595_9STRA|mmetsp:Transcript_10581/g.20374  ORF Transcript_10581/g.20374 Transcript_10581/m.20374 type:complete len:145 (+) Transcript_10581:24-458(+)|eukprot:scaffold8374_cov175-Amphora_coffeaeformis.AAC.104
MRCLVSLSCFIVSLGLTESSAFLGALRTQTTKRPTMVRIWQANEKDEPDSQDSIDKVTNTDEATFEEKMEKFLDTEWFNPKDVKEGSPLKWFADLVENDYATAEALYTSFFIAFMVLITQELVRMQVYGVNYVPFQKLRDGSLF